jgi:chromosome partitioning protein
MKTVAIISRKGGAGKTTLCTHLAVAAEARDLTTAIIDLDPQASAALWGDARGEDFPAVVPAQAPRLVSLLSQARQQGAKLVLIDTPPEADSVATEAALQADYILIPCRPSALDLNAIGASIRIAKTAGKPFSVVVSSAPVQGVEVSEMLATIQDAGVTVAPVVIHHRKAYSSRMTEGRTAGEIEPKGKAAGEIDALLLWVCDQTNMVTR